MIKGVTHAHLGPIWYQSEHSEIPHSPNQYLGWDFFAVSYNKIALDILNVKTLAKLHISTSHHLERLE